MQSYESSEHDACSLSLVVFQCSKIKKKKGKSSGGFLTYIIAFNSERKKCVLYAYQVDS